MHSALVRPSLSPHVHSLLNSLLLCADDIRKFDGTRPNLEGNDELCPLDLRMLISACWAHDPQQRPNPHEVVERLRSVSDAKNQETPAQSQLTHRPPKQQPVHPVERPEPEIAIKLETDREKSQDKEQEQSTDSSTGEATPATTKLSTERASPEKAVLFSSNILLLGWCGLVFLVVGMWILYY